MDLFLAILFVIICILLILVVLLQRGKGGGLGAAFGGGGGSAFGTRTGDVFTWVTIVLTGLFLLLAVVTTVHFRPPPQKVMAPEIIPRAEEISQEIEVRLTSRTKGAKIYYTTNGAEPTQDDVLYENKVKVRPGTLLRARAFLAGYEPSSIAEHHFRPAAGPESQPASAPALVVGDGPASAPAEPATAGPAAADEQ